MAIRKLLPLLLVTACNGQIGDAPASLVPPDPDIVTAAQCADGAIRPGPSPIRRLSRLEYDNTIRDLLGDSTHQGRALLQADEADPNGFDTEARKQGTSASTVEGFEAAAQNVAARAVAEAKARILPCDPASDAAACGRAFVASFGARAFRRPLTSDELARYRGFFEQARADFGFDGAMQLTIEAMLQSPNFLYRIENVPAGSRVGDIVPLDSYAVATRLSYTLLRSMPDDELRAKADSGALASADAIELEARRLMSKAQAREALHDFFDQWLRLEPLAAATKDDARFTPAVRDAMFEETRLFIDDAVWTQPNALATLLTGTHSFMNKTLADFYGVSGPTGDAFERVELDPTLRKGVLTRGAWLATTAGAAKTKPVIRGVFLKRELLCDALGDPPPDAEQTVSDHDASGQSRSVRDSFAAHVANPTCAACHTSIDALGFAFEGFGAVGETRAKDDNGFTVDASGVLLESDMTDTDPIEGEGTRPFRDAGELAELLVGSQKVVSCMVEQQMEFHLGRTQVGEDLCTRLAVESAWRDSGYDFRELLVALVRSDAFRYRRVLETDL